MNKTIYCTLDTETVGGIDHPKGFYNIGCAIHDKDGNILATTSLLVMESATMTTPRRISPSTPNGWQRVK